MNNRMVLAGFVAASLFSAAPLAFAADGGGSSGGGVSINKKKVKCKRGYVFSRSKKKCLRSRTRCKRGYTYSIFSGKCLRKRSGLMPDVELKEMGWQLARQGDFKEAASLFHLAANQKDPEILTGLGFSYRKQGDFEKGFGFYRLALSVDPKYVKAREYLGEGLVSIGRTDLARIQLDKIGNLCGRSCSEYVQLASYIKNERDGVNWQ